MTFATEELKSPAIWVDILLDQGFKISERKLRAKARDYGQFYSIGQTMMLHPQHVSEIIRLESEMVSKALSRKMSKSNTGGRNGK